MVVPGYPGIFMFELFSSEVCRYYPFLKNSKDIFVGRTNFSNTMNVKIALFQKGLMATYHIRKIDDQTFNAMLRDYSGDSRPPDYIRLFKTEAGWRSGFEDAELIRELGAAVDQFSINPMSNN